MILTYHQQTQIAVHRSLEDTMIQILLAGIYYKMKRKTILVPFMSLLHYTALPAKMLLPFAPF